tara:strand:+ start:1378 stop:1485 length:108 start_codon:yes stop_codon:yes gene_type:complete
MGFNKIGLTTTLLRKKEVLPNGGEGFSFSGRMFCG